MRSRSLLLGIALVSSACSSRGGTEPAAPPAARAESAPDVQTILAAMKERYRTAKTYQDEGTYRSVHRTPGKADDATTARFTTKWVAPGRLRFVFREDAPFENTLAVWTPSAGVTKVLFHDAVRDEPSLDDALGAMQGVSFGVTGLAPRFLAVGCACRAAYVLRGTVACGDGTCFQLEGSLGENEQVTLFVATKNHALVKYVRRGMVTPTPLSTEELERFPSEHRAALAARSLEPFEVDDTIELRPTFDAPLDASVFAEAPTSR